jgi:hypothetical protein
MALDVGQTYRATLTVADGNKLPVNPTGATLTVTTPDQATHNVPVTLPPAQTGLLIGDYQTAQTGLHRFDWLTTSPGTAATDYENVRAYRAAVSLADARESLNIQDPGHDQKIRTYLAAATRLAERCIGTLVIRTITGEFCAGDTRQVLQVQCGPLPSATSVTSVTSVWPGGPSWTQAAGDFVVNEDAGTIRLRSLLPFWWGPWRITYAAGRAEISEDIQTGVKEILWDLWATQRGNGTDQAEPTYEEVAAYEANYRPPGRVLQLLGAEYRPGFG